MYFVRRFVDGSTEICFGSEDDDDGNDCDDDDDDDQFGAELRFSEEHILHIARQSFTLHRARRFSKPSVLFFFRRLSREYYYASRVIPASRSPFQH